MIAHVLVRAAGCVGDANGPRIELVVKLGGSALTDKSTPHTLHAARFAECMDAVAALHHAGTALIVVHGAGSFGHFEAREFQVAAGAASALAMSRTHAAVCKLNAAVVEALIARDVPAVGVAPLLVPTRIRTDFVATLVDRGHLPVLHGDAVYTGDGATAIVSGDAIMVALALAFPTVTRAVFLSDVPGLLTSPPSPDAPRDLVRAVTVDEAGTLSVHAAATTAAHDVTGGMRAKVVAAGQCAGATRGRVVAFIAAAGSAAAHAALTAGGAPACTRVVFEPALAPAVAAAPAAADGVSPRRFGSARRLSPSWARKGS